MTTSRLAVFGAALALVAAPALAYGPGGGGACRQDLKTICSGLSPAPAPGPGNCLKALCGDLTPGSGAYVNCLQTKYTSQLSDACKQQLTDIQAKMTAFQTTCGGDISNFCGNVTGGTWSTVQCLHQAVINNQKVSSACQALLAQHPGRHHRPPAPDLAPAQ
jgi:hypothetical protein